MQAQFPLPPLMSSAKLASQLLDADRAAADAVREAAEASWREADGLHRVLRLEEQLSQAQAQMRDAADAARESRESAHRLQQERAASAAARAEHSTEVEREAVTRLAKNHARRSLQQAPAYARAAWPPPLPPGPASCSPPADALNEWGGTGDDADRHGPNLTGRPELPPMPGTEFVASSPARPSDRQWLDHASPSLPSTPHTHHSGQRRRTPLTLHSRHREQRGSTPLMPHSGHREQRVFTPLTPHSGRREQRRRTPSAELPPMWLPAGLEIASEATPRYGECDAATVLEARWPRVFRSSYSVPPTLPPATPATGDVQSAPPTSTLMPAVDASRGGCRPWTPLVAPLMRRAHEREQLPGRDELVALLPPPGTGRPRRSRRAMAELAYSASAPLLRPGLRSGPAAAQSARSGQATARTARSSRTPALASAQPALFT